MRDGPVLCPPLDRELERAGAIGGPGRIVGRLRLEELEVAGVVPVLGPLPGVAGHVAGPVRGDVAGEGHDRVDLSGLALPLPVRGRRAPRVDAAIGAAR